MAPREGTEGGQLQLILAPVEGEAGQTQASGAPTDQGDGMGMAADSDGRCKVPAHG
jgi:hypothetical protein